MSVLIDNEVDVALFQETWFSSQSNSTTSIIKSYGFNIQHAFREKVGAGVAIVWRNNVDKQVHCTSNSFNFESLQYQTATFNGKFKMVIICIYRLQEVPIRTFIKELNYLISKQNPAYPIVLAGDFNVHFENSLDSETKQLEYLTSSFGLSQFVCGASHKLGHTLDLVFVNDNDFAMQPIKPVCVDISDHFPVFFELPNCVRPSSAKRKQISYRNFKNINIPEFAINISRSLQSAFSSNVDTASFSELYNVYTDTITQEIDNVAPLLTKTISPSSSPPWMDAEYKENRAIRRRLEREWRGTSDQGDKALRKASYIQQRKVCADMCSEKRSNYHSQLIKSKAGDVRALFSIVNNVFDKTKSSCALPQHDSAKELVDNFNHYYVEKVNRLRDNIPVPTSDINDFVYFNGTILESFKPVNIQELRTILKESGIKTAYHDILPAKLMKEVINELLPHLCDLVNKSLSTGSVEGIKDSIIVPLLKKHGLDPDILKNYRPVANLVFLSKLIERVVLKRLDAHMSSQKLHCKYQHGYKKNHSPETLLLRLTNDILCGMDCSLATIILLIDLSAAFDTVDLDLLLHILQCEFGVCGIALNWFKSFLSGRNQRVRIENTLSESLNVDFGVPQGSVLGPVLFNIYIQSLFRIIQKNGFSTSGYADDNNAYESFALNFQFELISQKLPDLMTQIRDWMNRHFLKINPDKTEIIVFLPSNSADIPTINGTFIDGNCIRFSNVVKNLGFRLDRFLTMEPHVDAIVSHCYKLISDVARNRKLLSDSDTESLMHAIVSSRIDYCNSLFYGVRKDVIYKLQKIQNAAARLITKRRKRESVKDALIKLHWLRVEERIVFKILVTAFKCFHHTAPECLIDLLTVRSVNSFLFTLKYLDSDFGRRSFSYAAPRYWNALPIEIRSAPTLDTFKRLTKHLLFNNFHEYKNKVFLYT